MLADILCVLGNHNVKVMVERNEIMGAFIIIALSDRLRWIRERPDVWHDVVSIVERALNNVFELDCEDDAAAFGALARIVFPPEYDVSVGVVPTGKNMVHAIFAIDGTVYDFTPQQKMPGGFIKSYNGAVWRRLKPYEGKNMNSIITAGIEIAGHALGITGESVLDRLFDRFASAKAPQETQPEAIDAGAGEAESGISFEAITTALAPHTALTKIDEKNAQIGKLKKEVSALQGDKKKSEAAMTKAKQETDEQRAETAKVKNELQSVRNQLVNEQSARRAAEQVKEQQVQQLTQLQNALRAQLSSNRNAIVLPQANESLEQLRNARAYIESPDYLATLTATFMNEPDSYWQVMGTVTETGAALEGLAPAPCCDACATGKKCTGGACASGHDHESEDVGGDAYDAGLEDVSDGVSDSESEDVGGDAYDVGLEDVSDGVSDSESDDSGSCITCAL